MSRDGVIDCLGYLSMPLSLVQRPLMLPSPVIWLTHVVRF